MNIGIIGQGFVGTAIREGLKNSYPVFVYDKKEDICPEASYRSLDTVVGSCEIIFQCLPTPMRKSGECDLTIVEKSLKDLSSLSRSYNKNPIVVIKSTVPPGTCERLNQEFENINIVFSPEFLTEANSIDDFKNQAHVILGGPRPYTTQVKIMFRKAFPHIPIVETGYQTAEMVKYVANTFLATKVAFANEIYDICCATGVEYKEVVEFAKLDERLGNSHWQVPGPDTKRGFGGSCFPKDINALIAYAESTGIEPNILKTVWKKNLQVRPERDWEQLVGRSIAKEEKNNE